MTNINLKPNKNQKDITQNSTRPTVKLSSLHNAVALSAVLRGVTKEELKADFRAVEKVNQSVCEGNLTHIEEMLINQAHVLESIFQSYTEKMLATKYVEQLEAFSNIALKAQKQCRNTLVALVEIKKPKQPAFIRQQNNALNQQINHIEPNSNSEKNKNYENELLQVSYDTLDERETFKTIPAHPTMETVGEINRRKDK